MKTRALAALAVWWLPVAAMAQGHVTVMTMDSEIFPGSAAFLEKALEQADTSGAAALVIELDTPGGLLTTTQDIVSMILNAEVPVIVWVGPRGAWAASAGTFITLAGHVAAMAPGTTIGAAHPVSLGGPNPKPPTDPNGNREATDFSLEKVENFTIAFIESIAEVRERNVEWAMEAVRDSVAINHTEALEKNVVDLIAEDLEDLLEKADGRTVRVGREDVVLATAGARIERIEPTALDKIYSQLVNPQVAVILILVAAAGLYVEIQNPGLLIPGAVGLLALVLAGFAFQVLPFSWLGMLILLSGVGLLIAEVFVTSYGLLFAGGLTLFALGSYMVFRIPEVGEFALPVLEFILPVTLVLAGFFAIIVWGVTSSFRRPQFAGIEALVGADGVADSDIDPEGRIFFRGELWKARSADMIPAGERVEILEVNDLVLTVRRAPETRS